MNKDYPDNFGKIEEAFFNKMGENNVKISKIELPDKWKYLTKKLAYPYEFFNCIENCQNSVENLKKANFFSKLINTYPDDEKIEHRKQIFKLFIIKNGQEITQILLKSDELLLPCVFEKFRKVSVNDFGIISLLYCLSLPSYTGQVGLKYTGIKLQTLQDKDMILLLEKNIRGDISSVMVDRYVKSIANKKDIIFRS